MVIGLKKNVCQNPKCCENSTKDRYNKKLEAYKSYKRKKRNQERLDRIKW